MKKKRELTDEDSSMILRYASTVTCPPTVKRDRDPRLMSINECAAFSMLDAVMAYEINEDGTEFNKAPSRDEARTRLLAWLHEIGMELSKAGLLNAAKDAVNPLPPGSDPLAATRLFLGLELPSRSTLVHCLFSLGIGPHIVTGACLLLECAQREQSRQRKTVRAL